MAALIAAWRAADRPLVYVKHEFETHGHDFKDVVTGEPDLLVTKTVNSAFYGAPDLDGWLRSARHRRDRAVRDQHRPLRGDDRPHGRQPRL